MSFISKIFNRTTKPKPGISKMQFAIVNKSTDKSVTSAILTQIAAACERQLYEDYAAFWEGVGSKVSFVSDEKNAPSGAVLVIIFDHADQAGALGYHDVTPQGLPYARIFWEPIRDNGGSLFGGAKSLSVTISHEVLETVGDPYANFWAQNPKTGKLHALELADAVESDAYVIDGIYVSNFVGPRFFREGSGPYDWMSQLQGGTPLLTKPFESRADGYQITGDGLVNIESNFGRTYPQWKK